MRRTSRFASTTPDLISNGYYYPGPVMSAIEDDYFVNLYDYKETS